MRLPLFYIVRMADRPWWSPRGWLVLTRHEYEQFLSTADRDADNCLRREVDGTVSDTRDRLAEELANPRVRQLGDRLQDRLREHANDCMCDRWVTHHSQVLAPVVAELVREGQAEALEAAAVQADLAWGSPFAHVLRARAAALRAATADRDAARRDASPSPR